jgi:hypothetical protein
MSDYAFSYDDLDDMINSASSDFDFSNYFTGGGENFDFGSLDPNAFSFDDIDSMLSDATFGAGGFDLGGVDLDSIANLGIGDFDLGGVDLPQSLSNIDLSSGMDLGGLGLTPTGRGQLSIRDPETGATGLTAEGFTSLKDLLGSGTAEEIDRYTPGSADYSIRSGLETPDGLGLSSDATRGMGLDFMGGGQGISKYVPAEYGGSVLEDLIARNPGQFGAIEDYLNENIFGGKGLTPFKGTGGTLSEAGFLAQSSAANPRGAQYALGDPKSFINRPSVTGDQASVSPGRTVIDNKDGTYKVVTEKDGKTVTQTVDDKGKTLSTKTTDGTKAGTTTKAGAQQNGLSALLPLLLALLAMNRGGGGSGEGKATVIPGLTATQRQTPYTQQQRAPGYRPGQGGISYFDQTQYTPRMAAGGGIARLLDGPGDGVSDSIPAVIDGGMAGGGQPAKVARGEYIFDARSVAALGNGSTDAGAERLDKMREDILRDDRKAKIGEDSKAYRHLLA